MRTFISALLLGAAWELWLNGRLRLALRFSPKSEFVWLTKFGKCITTSHTYWMHHKHVCGLFYPLKVFEAVVVLSQTHECLMFSLNLKIWHSWNILSCFLLSHLSQKWHHYITINLLVDLASSVVFSLYYASKCHTKRCVFSKLRWGCRNLCSSQMPRRTH